MSRARHKHRASGGKLSSKPEFEAGGESNAAKEAEERKHGGKVKHHGEGEKSKHRGDKAPRRARGGKVGHGGPHETHEVKSHSMKHHHGMHVPGRKRGGGIGSNLHPLTTAANVKHVTPGEQPEAGDHSD